MPRRFHALMVVVGLFSLAGAMEARQHTILAIGAHAADMELTAGAILAHEKVLGNRIVLLHMTLGEGGDPKLSPQKYAIEKKQEAMQAAKILGAEVLFAPYADGMLPNNDEARRFVADVIRQVKPDTVITHWKNSMHKDHSNTHAIVVDAVLMASLEGVKTEHPPFRGVKHVYYAENWEDAEGYEPYVYVNAGECGRWKEAIRAYRMVRGGVSSFAYFDYYTALVRMRGAQIGKSCAETLDIDDYAKRMVVEALP